MRRRYAGGFEAASRISFSVARGRVPLADDKHLIRGAPAALEDDLVVVAEAATGPEALALARAHRPDAAVLDPEMPGADGVSVATSLRAELPGCRTMIVTSHGRPGHLKQALAAGVRAFVPKTVSARQRPASFVPSTPETVMWIRSWLPTRSPPGTRH